MVLPETLSEAGGTVVCLDGMKEKAGQSEIY